MLRNIILILTCSICLTCLTPGYAFKKIGIQFNYGSLGTIKTRPEKTNQYGIQLQYYLKQLILGQMQIYFQGGIEHLHTDIRKTNYADTANNFSFGPIFKLDLTSNLHNVVPYISASALPGYISERKFGNLDLGSYFTFRDTIAIGAILGRPKNIDISLSFIHYSHLIGAPNPGLNIPLQIGVTYMFT